MVELQILDAGRREWSTLATTQITIPGYLARFKIPYWNSEIRHDYRILYRLTDAGGQKKPYYYYGVIVQDPVDKDEIVVAAFTVALIGALSKFVYHCGPTLKFTFRIDKFMISNLMQPSPN